MSELRRLHFETLGEAVDDAGGLLASGYTRQGNWSLGQICRHLILVQDSSSDGYPAWMSLFTTLRPLMRRWLLPKLLRADSPRGIRTAPMFMPPDGLDDAFEVEAFSASVERLIHHSGEFSPHPAFGRMPHDKILFPTNARIRNPSSARPKSGDRETTPIFLMPKASKRVTVGRDSHRRRARGNATVGSDAQARAALTYPLAIFLVYAEKHNR